jgi:hypothetical protein
MTLLPIHMHIKTIDIIRVIKKRHYYSRFFNLLVFLCGSHFHYFLCGHNFPNIGNKF